MKHFLFGAIAGALLCAPALAQPRNNNAFGAENGAVFALPPSVSSVVSVDALNTLIIAQDGERAGETRYSTAKIQHVYSGGIARLFGSTSIPTAQFATPGLLNGGNQNNGFGGNNQNGANNFGGNGFGASNFGGNAGNFGANNFGGNGFGSFGNGSFGNGGFGNAILGGNGFNTANRNGIVSARVRPR